ncbi:MAG TPA: hypothetical protein VG936_01410 [Lacunisphaera sp.]|nr:hypothetical protein [Lacunisphaera sp.]
MAASITVVLAALMLSVTTVALRTWQRTQDASAMAMQAKLALDLLERDLQAAIQRNDDSGNTWLAVDVINDPSALAKHGWLTASQMKPITGESTRLVPVSPDGAPRLIDARFGLSGVWLRLMTATTETTSDAGVPHAVAYQIARRPVSGPVSAGNPAAVRYTLFRTCLSGAATFANGNDLAAAAYKALANPGTSADPLATDVVDFGVWLYVRDGSGALRRIFPADNADLNYGAVDTNAGGVGKPGPAVGDVMVRILTGEGVRLLEAMEKSSSPVVRPENYSDDAMWWWSVVEANSRVFVRRIEIRGAGW